MSITILAERPDTEVSQALIAELETFLAPFYPVASRHGYSVEKLIKQGVAFFVMRKDDIPAGCGGVQIFGADYGEVKRMFVRPQFRGLGLAQMMLKHLTSYTQERGVNILRLETGIHQVEAIGLYEKMGFVQIAPFGDYQEDPLSRFYEKRLDE